jgi:hypothetical protein
VAQALTTASSSTVLVPAVGHAYHFACLFYARWLAVPKPLSWVNTGLLLFSAVTLAFFVYCTNRDR